MLHASWWIALTKIYVQTLSSNVHRPMNGPWTSRPEQHLESCEFFLRLSITIISENKMFAKPFNPKTLNSLLYIKFCQKCVGWSGRSLWCLACLMKVVWQWKSEGHWDLHTSIFFFWRSAFSQTDLCAERGTLVKLCGLRVGGLLCQHAHLQEHRLLAETCMHIHFLAQDLHKHLLTKQLCNYFLLKTHLI